MSTEQMSEKAKQTLKSVKELLDKAEESTRRALDKAAPKVKRSVGSSMDSAAKGFSATMKSIDGATSKEQLDLLRAYRRVLGAQVDFVDSRISAVESKVRTGQA
jgi:vacuolar-type H+-ATPase subunit E/Vma4